MAEQSYEGGCLCGRIRYRATGEPQPPALLPLPDVPARRRRAADRLGQLPARGLRLGRRRTRLLPLLAGPAARLLPDLRRLDLHDRRRRRLCLSHACEPRRPRADRPDVPHVDRQPGSWLKVDDPLPRHEGQA